MSRAPRAADALWYGRRDASPSTAYVYDWNILPLGQQLWLRELETYINFPPLQAPSSYNLEQVLQQVREMKTAIRMPVFVRQILIRQDRRELWSKVRGNVQSIPRS
jgi:hypothetical protein